MKRRLAEINGRIAAAAESVGRNPTEVTMVAVSKTFSTESILEAYDLGVRDFGESRLQEALPKMEALPKDIIWHFVGTLQSNKARQIARLFQLIHSLASESAAREMAKESGAEALIEINLAKEQQKSGIIENSLDEFCNSVLHYSQVHLRGLMTIGPALEPEEMRPYFRKLRRMGQERGLPIFSMGMSSDFEVAVQEGSTHLRIGRALFGVRR